MAARSMHIILTNLKRPTLVSPAIPVPLPLDTPGLVPYPSPSLDSDTNVFVYIASNHFASFRFSHPSNAKHTAQYRAHFELASFLAVSVLVAHPYP